MSSVDFTVPVEGEPAKSTYWEYRLVREAHAGGTSVSIREVYFRDGELWGCSERPIGASGEDENGCLDDYKMMAKAFALPTLDLRDFPKARTTP
jgi:hypothetical protein